MIDNTTGKEICLHHRHC